MTKPLFTPKGFDRSAILKRAWAIFRTLAAEGHCQANDRAAFTILLREVWADARRERAEVNSPAPVRVTFYDRCLRDAIGPCGPLKNAAKKLGIHRDAFRFALETLCERGLVDQHHIPTAAGTAKRLSLIAARGYADA